MADQTYAPLLNVTEPDQVTGVPTSADQVKKKELTEELGGTGTRIYSGYLTETDYNPDFTGTKRIDLFNEMRTDATVRAGLSAVKNPLLSADWYIKDPNGEAAPNGPTELVDKQLLHNENFTWTSLLRQILTFCDYGNSIFEKVFEPLPDGKIGWKKFGHRMSKTIYRWTMDDGVSPGIYQILPTGKTAHIPRWKLLYFINEQEGSNYEGFSLLRAPHKNWFYKVLYYKIDALAAEKQGMGMPVLKQTMPNINPQDMAKGIEIVKNMRANEKIHMVLPPGLTIEFLDMKAMSLKDTKDMIDHHDRQILMAFQAQFLDLGKQSGGSYALSADQTRLFLLCLEYLAKIIQEEFNKAIKELVDLNFNGVKEYPTLEYGAIGDVDTKQLSESLKTLADGKFITPTIEIEEHLLNTFKLPKADNLAELREAKEEQATALLTKKTDPEPEEKNVKDEDEEDDDYLLEHEDEKPKKKAKPVKTIEFMENIMTFREDAEELLTQLEQVIAEKRTHATRD